MATTDATVRLQALNGTWETCGADRAIGVLQESLGYTHDKWGPKTASFTLKRPVFLLWPDLGAFTPVEIEIGGVVVWEGRTDETPIKAGGEQQISVQCEGWQAHLDDDVFARTYVHAKLTDWKDVRSSLAADLTNFVAGPQVQVGAGMISLTYPKEQASAGQAAVVLDMGQGTLAARVIIEWEATAGAANRAMFLGWGETPGGQTTTETFYSAAGASSGTYAKTLTTASRYVYIGHAANAHTPAADETLKLKSIIVVASTAYETGNASILLASTIIPDALERATLLLSSDYSQIAATSFHIPDFTIAKLSTPREAIEAANAYHNWVTKLGLNRRFEYQPRPTSPVLEIGAWSQADTEDASANSGAEIYNRAIVEATGPDGSPLLAERTAAQQSGVMPRTPTSPAISNPSFAVNTEGWALTAAGVFARDTSAADYRSSPACGKWASGKGGEQLVATFTGVFTKGTTYLVTFYMKCRGNTYVSLGTATDAAEQLAIGSQLPEALAYKAVTIAWTPSANTSEGALRIMRILAADPIFVDDVSITTIQPTLIDRRNFRRTKVIQMSSAITVAEGNQLADIFLESHTTTPFKGSAAATPGSVRRVLGGQPVHPSQLGNYTQQLVRCGNLIDPDTGGIGRDGTIAETSYTHKDQKAQVTLDDSRGNFDALLNRLAVVQTPGS